MLEADVYTAMSSDCGLGVEDAASDEDDVGCASPLGLCNGCRGRCGPEQFQLRQRNSCRWSMICKARLGLRGESRTTELIIIAETRLNTDKYGAANKQINHDLLSRLAKQD